MARMVAGPTTKIVGPLRRADRPAQRTTHPSGDGGLGPRVQGRWTSESVDPFRRIFDPETRPVNVPMRSWRDVADGPVNPKRVQVKNPQRMAEIIKGVAKFKWPERLEVVKALPVTPTGKVQRSILRERLQQRLGIRTSQ